MEVNKHLELLKTLVKKHRGLLDHTQAIEQNDVVVSDLKRELARLICPELEKCISVQRKHAVVKWIAASPYATPRAAVEIDGRLVSVYTAGKDLPEVTEGQRIEVDVRPDAYGSYDVLDFHLPAQALVSETAATEAAT